MFLKDKSQEKHSRHLDRSALSLAISFAALLVSTMAFFQVDNYLLRPRLCLELQNPAGEMHETTRYYHIQVVNDRRWRPAHAVQVFLMRVEDQSSDKARREPWPGEVAMQWRLEKMGPRTRTVGPVARH